MYVTMVVCIALWYEDFFIYVPEGSAPMGYDPKRYGFPTGEEVSMPADDGTMVSGWWIPAEKDDNGWTVLWSHGNAEFITSRDYGIDPLLKLGFSVLVYDYRGYGNTPGKPSEKGLYLDGDAAYQYLIHAKDVKPERLILIGESLGSAVAIELAKRHPDTALLVTDGAFTSIPAMAFRKFGLPIGFILRHRYDNLSKIASLRMPVMIIHGELDDIIPVRMARSLYAAAPEPKLLWVMPNTEHNSTWTNAGLEYPRRILQFANEHAK